MCFDLLYKFETFVILRRTERYTDRPTERPTDRPTDQPNTHASPHLNSPILTSYFNETWIFWTEIRKLLKSQISWNHIWAKFFMWTDGRTDTIQTDMMKLTVTFGRFTKTSRKGPWSVGKWIWTASGCGMQVDMDCKWIWSASEYGLQMNMDCKWIWTASGYGLHSYFSEHLPVLNPSKRGNKVSCHEIVARQNTADCKISEWYNLTVLPYRCTINSVTLPLYHLTLLPYLCTI